MKFHLIGICGTGMGSVATLLKQAGHQVRGSDEGVYPPMSDLLAEVGIPIMEPFGPKNLAWGPDIVVVGNVCRKDHIEVLEAQRLGLPLESMASVLEKFFLTEREPIVVAGTHGKTTTTSLLAHLLTSADMVPGFLVGGVPTNFHRSSDLGTGPHFVIEGDEYDTAFFDKTPKFHHYRPKYAILTSVEYDHADIYPDFAAVKQAFAHFASLLPEDGLLVAHADVPPEVLDGVRAPVWLYRVEDADSGQANLSGRFANPMAQTGTKRPLWHAVIVSDAPDSAGSVFQIYNPAGEFVGTFRIGLRGRHNVANALAALLICYKLGMHRPSMSRGLATFRGVRRRQEFRGLAQGVTVIDDFAHHPTAVLETLLSFRNVRRGNRLIAVFDPRSNTTRRNVFQKELADALSAADEVFIGPLRNVERIPEKERLDTDALAASIRAQQVASRAFKDLDSLLDRLLKTVRAGDLVVFMSSGSFGNLPARILMGLGDPITPAVPADVPALHDILEGHGLTREDLARQIHDYHVVRGPDHLAGCIGMEVAYPYGLLKDLVVIPERRGMGLGWMLARGAVDQAARLGLDHVFMFGTERTKKIGEILGFGPWDRDVPDELADSPQFARPQHAGAVLMAVSMAEEDKSES